jgi:hypothetical protein
MFDFLKKTARAAGEWDYLNTISDAANDPKKFTKLEDILGMGVNIGLGIAIAVSFIGTVLSGIKFMKTRSGDPREMETAKKALTYSFVAFFLAISSFTIVDLIVRTTGLRTRGAGNTFTIFRIFTTSPSGQTGGSTPGSLTPDGAPRDDVR